MGTQDLIQGQAPTTAPGPMPASQHGTSARQSDAGQPAPAFHRYTSVAIAFHWVIAALILFQIGMGLWLSNALGADDADARIAAFQQAQLHKSVGLTVLFLSVLRLVWRLAYPAPPLPDGMTAFERFGAHVSHLGFYVVMIAIPLSGWAMVSASPTLGDVPTLYFGLIDIPDLPILPGLGEALQTELAENFHLAHKVMALGTVALLLLHVGAALKHHVVNRDAVLARMVPGVRPRAPHAAARVYIGRSGAGRTLAAFLVGAISMGGVAAILAYDRAPIVQVAATTTPSAPLPTGKAQLWSVVEDESRLGFSGTQMGAGFDGEFTAFKALIEFDPERLDASEVVVVIDLASATTGDPVNDGTLVGGDWLAVSDHPKGTFTATEFVAGEAPGSYTAKGALTLRGIEKPFELPFALQIEGERARMQAEVVINRLDFGIGAKPDPAGATISLEIPVKVDLTAVKATPTPAPATGAGG